MKSFSSMHKVFFVLLSAMSCTAVFAQDKNTGAFMVPSRVYVGDRASLILPLPGFAVKEDSETASVVSPAADIDIHRALLERRPVGSRLTVEFTAYATGILELPPIVIAGEVFSGLTIEISSILEKTASGAVLSGPAPPLAIPGTSLLVYGSIISILFSLSLAFWVLFWGRKRIKGWLAFWKKKRLLAGMRGIEKRLRKTLVKGDDTCRNILDALSREFRGFLSHFTGEHCHAMTALEFANIELHTNREFLKDFFRRCDGIRFGGGRINKNEVLSILDDLKQFLAALSGAPLSSAPPLSSAHTKGVT
ncbi:MAG: hypothetical protein LBU85_07265 [Treponema sp.]|jgi:hypothetical protein|nr:hypothetical protein [Treponema sp.]